MFEFYTNIESFNIKSPANDPDIMVIDTTFPNLYLEKELERIFTTFHIKHTQNVVKYCKTYYKCCQMLSTDNPLFIIVCTIF